MRIAVFSTKPHDREYLDRANGAAQHELVYLDARLTEQTASLAEGFAGVCAFVNDDLGAAVLEQLAAGGVEVIALRSAGFNHVDLAAADRLGLTVVRVPAYSPHAVAEHTVGLILTLNRHIHRAAARVREGNFALTGLLGFDLHGRTVGVVGTGQIGAVFSRIMAGFGCQVVAHDPYPSDELDVDYVPLDELYEQADIVSLHCPLTPQTHHLIGPNAIDRMRDGVMLINTSRGALVDTVTVTEGLKSGRIGSLGIDVYEEEEQLFFQDLSDQVITDDVFMRLVTFPNVLVTAHQGFFTREALEQIGTTTIANLTAIAEGRAADAHVVRVDRVA